MYIGEKPNRRQKGNDVTKVQCSSNIVKEKGGQASYNNYNYTHNVTHEHHIPFVHQVHCSLSKQIVPCVDINQCAVYR